MFAHLFRQYLFISFYRAFAQSLAGENAARLMAMQAAEKNIIELQDDLQARFREQRQAAITSELLDIISGFEALKEEDIYEIRDGDKARMEKGSGKSAPLNQH